MCPLITTQLMRYQEDYQQKKIENHGLWLYGPLFLHGHSSKWPAPFKMEENDKPILEASTKIKTIMAATSENNLIDQIKINNYFRRLQRIVAYIYNVGVTNRIGIRFRWKRLN